MTVSANRHRHRAIPSRTETRPFSGPVGRHPDPRAHGNVCEVEFCSCGAVRRTNVNRRWMETSGWIVPAWAEEESA